MLYASPSDQARLAAYAHARDNFDATKLAEYTTATGWQVDEYEAALPAEAPGPALENGSFAAARQVLQRYSFPPPDLITGIFAPGQPLPGRIMLLRARFLFFTFWFGVRVSEVTDETGPAEQVWGYSYRTLEGHFERGQIWFSLHKTLASGAVSFRIRAVSQTGPIRNPFYWLGFKIFGRYLQRRFARESMRRLHEQVAELLAAPS